MMEKQFQNVKHNIIFALILKLIKLIAKEIILQVVKTKDVKKVDTEQDEYECTETTRYCEDYIEDYGE